MEFKLAEDRSTAFNFITPNKSNRSQLRKI